MGFKNVDVVVVGNRVVVVVVDIVVTEVRTGKTMLHERHRNRPIPIHVLVIVG
jgi:septum formation inhibitor-activating ATPase MinD